VYTLFAPYSSSYPFPHHPSAHTSANPHCDFVEVKNVNDKMRNMAFLLVWYKDNYTGSFLVLFPCMYVLQLQLIHLFQSSSLLPSPLPVVALASLKFRYSFLYSEHIKHIKVFGFLPRLYLSLHNHPLVCPMSHNITAFVLGL
jgi:hypothetical protein